jgi:hypothetical protein
VCAEIYKPWRWILFVVVCLLIDSFCQFKPKLLIGTCLLGFTWLHFVIGVANEMADILQIPIFKVPQSKEKDHASINELN